jgi:hypothetical protein
MSASYHTRFGSLSNYEKGRVEPVADDPKNYAFSNCFEIANNSKPYEKVVFGINQIYVLEVIRAEGRSPWYTCAHDEFALCMDGEVEIQFINLDLINCYKRVHPGSPFGGTGQSGYGRDMGFEAMREYTQVKSVWVNVDAPTPAWYPR